MTTAVAIHWFRQDLRLSDNPALTKACEHDAVLPIYVLDNVNAGDDAMGAASRWWLHHSLQELARSLDQQLSLYVGNPLDVLLDLASRYDVEAVYWNRIYEPWCVARDTLIKQRLTEAGIRVVSCNGSLLWEPWEIKKNDDTPYRVFTPFYRKGCLNADAPRLPLPDAQAHACLLDQKNSLTLEQLHLLPTVNWDQKLVPHWPMGEEGAQAFLQRFMAEGLVHYKDGRNFPAKPFVSRLSPYLHWGQVSPNQLWHAMLAVAHDCDVDHFCAELGWREFAYSQLYHFPDLPKRNLQAKFDHFPWVKDDAALAAWQQGRTGIPMVDAGMRELWQTGYMHNRVRMIVASFLVKNLLIDWRFGERWFWDTLVDADLASNSASWQWVAGCGADAAPYFRIFNPVTQGQKFDPEGEYVRRFVPELSQLPNRYLFAPWEAPAHVLQSAGVDLGLTYPKPIVDLKASRQRALQAFKSLSEVSN